MLDPGSLQLGATSGIRLETEFYVTFHPQSGNRGELLPPSPLRTQHATFTALRSSLCKAFHSLERPSRPKSSALTMST